HHDPASHIHAPANRRGTANPLPHNGTTRHRIRKPGRPVGSSIGVNRPPGRGGQHRCSLSRLTPVTSLNRFKDSIPSLLLAAPAPSPRPTAPPQPRACC